MRATPTTGCACLVVDVYYKGSKNALMRKCEMQQSNGEVAACGHRKMVNYGKSLLEARRPGWEDSYLDYEGLKNIRNHLEILLVERSVDIAASLDCVASDSPHREKYFALRKEFAGMSA